MSIVGEQIKLARLRRNLSVVYGLSFESRLFVYLQKVKSIKPSVMRSHFYSFVLAFAVALAATVTTHAQTVLFQSQPDQHIYYRIPAIASHGNTLWAFGDDRSGVTDATAWGDIGSVGNISLLVRKSTNRGRSWTPATVAVQGHGEAGFDKGHGDAAVVSDRETGKLLLICASGEVRYGLSDVKVTRTQQADGSYRYAQDLRQAQRVGRYYSNDGGKSWQGEEISESIYNLFNTASAETYDEGNGNVAVERLFFSSGRICQSALIKVKDYYRIYAVLTTNQGSLVIFSDDFGQSWSPLGGSAARPAPQGDEAKVEELPDGRVLLSCRMLGGRYFNIFNYTSTDRAAGEWAKPVASTSLEGGTAGQDNATNGEILILPAKGRDGKPIHIALQSIPFGNTKGSERNVERRSHVSIYWKVLSSPADYATPECFLTGWTRYEVTPNCSAYSTMVPDGKGNIAFIYEDNGEQIRCGSQNMEVYDLTFRTYSLEMITGGAYRYHKR